MRDDRPVQRWVRIVPIVFAVVIVLAVNYPALADHGLGFTLALLAATQLVGWGEEAVFRGLGGVTLRKHSLSEGRVALWSSVIFGAVHLSNVIGGGAGAIPQAIMVSLAGYFFYLIRRVTKGNTANSIIHGLFDFALLTSTGITTTGTNLGMLLGILLYPVLGIILLVRRHQIEQPTTS